MPTPADRHPISRGDQRTLGEDGSREKTRHKQLLSQIKRRFSGQSRSEETKTPVNRAIEALTAPLDSVEAAIGQAELLRDFVLQNNATASSSGEYADGRFYRMSELFFRKDTSLESEIPLGQLATAKAIELLCGVEVDPKDVSLPIKVAFLTRLFVLRDLIPKVNLNLEQSLSLEMQGLCVGSHSRLKEPGFTIPTFTEFQTTAKGIVAKTSHPSNPSLVEPGRPSGGVNDMFGRVAEVINTAGKSDMGQKVWQGAESVAGVVSETASGAIGRAKNWAEPILENLKNHGKGILAAGERVTNLFNGNWLGEKISSIRAALTREVPSESSSDKLSKRIKKLQLSFNQPLKGAHFEPSREKSTADRIGETMGSVAIGIAAGSAGKLAASWLLGPSGLLLTGAASAGASAIRNTVNIGRHGLAEAMSGDGLRVDTTGMSRKRRVWETVTAFGRSERVVGADLALSMAGLQERLLPKIIRDQLTFAKDHVTSASTNPDNYKLVESVLGDKNTLVNVTALAIVLMRSRQLGYKDFWDERGKTNKQTLPEFAKMADEMGQKYLNLARTHIQIFLASDDFRQVNLAKELIDALGRARRDKMETIAIGGSFVVGAALMAGLKSAFVSGITQFGLGAAGNFAELIKKTVEENLHRSPVALQGGTPTPTASATATGTTIPSPTPTTTSTAVSPTGTPTSTSTATTVLPTATPSATNTLTPQPSNTPTPFPTTAPTTVLPSPTATATNLPPSATPTNTPSLTPNPSATASPTSAPSNTPTAVPPTNTPTPTSTSVLPTATPSATNTLTPQPSNTPTPFPTTAPTTVPTPQPPSTNPVIPTQPETSVIPGATSSADYFPPKDAISKAREAILDGTAMPEGVASFAEVEIKNTAGHTMQEFFQGKVSKIELWGKAGAQIWGGLFEANLDNIDLWKKSFNMADYAAQHGLGANSLVVFQELSFNAENGTFDSTAVRSLIDKAQGGDMESIKKLQAIWHWLPANMRIKIPIPAKN